MCKRRRTVICCLSLQTYGSRYGAVLFVMDNKNSILLDENTHRLLMCCRMAKSMSVGEVFLDATTHRIVWCIAQEGKPNLRFSSLDEMEQHLEHLLMVRAEKIPNGLANMDKRVKRRADIISERRRARTNGGPMLFSSKINRTHG